MRYKSRWLSVAAFFLLVGGMQTSALAMPRGGGAVAFRGAFHGGFHGGGFGRGIVVRPAFGFGWGWGWGYDPWYWDPYYYPGPVEVRRVNYGTVEFKVKPADTKVYVDQKFLGTVNSLDHHKAYVAGGNHDIKLVAPDGNTLDRTVYVPVGRQVKIEQRF